MPTVPLPAFHDALKARQRALREGFPTSLGLRVHRAISWLGRAEAAGEDVDLRFILSWIAFNSAYAGEISLVATSERDAFRTYFDALVRLDEGRRIDNLVWARFPHEIQLLLKNRYVYAPFWAHQNGTPGHADWEKRLAGSMQVMGQALGRRDTGRVLCLVFDRLYVLRNQLVHGGATWNSGINRAQVRDGAAILSSLLPVFVDLMMDHPLHPWGAPYYPVVEG